MILTKIVVAAAAMVAMIASPVLGGGYGHSGRSDVSGRFSERHSDLSDFGGRRRRFHHANKHYYPRGEEHDNSNDSNDSDDSHQDSDDESRRTSRRSNRRHGYYPRGYSYGRRFNRYYPRGDASYDSDRSSRSSDRNFSGRRHNRFNMYYY